MFPVFNFTIIHNWVHINSPHSQWLARCYVTRQRCIALHQHWNSLQNRKAPSLSSPDAEEIFLHRLAKSWQADVFIRAKVSTAMCFDVFEDSLSRVLLPTWRLPTRKRLCAFLSWHTSDRRWLGWYGANSRRPLEAFLVLQHRSAFFVFGLTVQLLKQFQVSQFVERIVLKHL